MIPLEHIHSIVDYARETLVKHARTSVVDEEGLELSGRSGSIEFENKLKALLSEVLDDCVSEINDFALLHYNTLCSIDLMIPDDASDEGAKRTFCDMSFTLLDQSAKEEHFIPINIKYTRGNTFDNVGGWSVLGYIGFNRSMTEKQVLEHAENAQKIDNQGRDYYLWSFLKYQGQTSLLESLDSNVMTSLLAAGEESYKYNAKQSFPLQFNSSKAQSLQDSDLTYEDSRNSFLQLLTYLVECEINYHKTKLNKLEIIRSKQLTP